MVCYSQNPPCHGCSALTAFKLVFTWLRGMKRPSPFMKNTISKRDFMYFKLRTHNRIAGGFSPPAPTTPSMRCDLKSLIILIVSESAYCIVSSFLPRHALLVTALCEARVTMKPSVNMTGRENRERIPTLEASIRMGAINDGMCNIYKLPINVVRVYRPKMLTGLNQKVSTQYGT